MFCERTLKTLSFCSCCAFLKALSASFCRSSMACCHRCLRAPAHTRDQRIKASGGRRVERCRKVTLMAMATRDNTRYSWNHKFMTSPFYQHVYHILLFYNVSIQTCRTRTCLFYVLENCTLKLWRSMLLDSQLSPWCVWACCASLLRLDPSMSQARCGHRYSH